MPFTSKDLGSWQFKREFVLEKKHYIIAGMGIALSLTVLMLFYKNFEEVNPNTLNNATVALEDEKHGEPSDPPTQKAQGIGAFTALNWDGLTEVQTGSDAGGCAYDKAEHTIYIENREGDKTFEDQENALKAIVQAVLDLPSWNMNENGFPTGCLTGHRVEDVGNFYRFGEDLLIMPSSNGVPAEDGRDPEFYIATYVSKLENKTVALCFESNNFKEIISDLAQKLKLSNDCEF